MKLIFVWTLVLLAAISCPSINAEDEDEGVEEVEDVNLGTQVDIYAYPSLAQVEIRVGVLWVQQCVGSILTSIHILSAASCFSGSLYLPESRRLRAGSSIRGQGGSVVSIDREFNHPDYNSQGDSDSDIAVVRLEIPLMLGGAMQQTSILAPAISLPVGLPIVLVGWGNTAQGAHSNSSADNNLYSLDLYTYNFNTCVDQYSDHLFPANVTSNMFCAGLGSTTGRDVDPRDVGAPLFYQNVVVGLISFGGRDFNNTLPLVSTAVSPFTEWIVGTAIF